MEVAITKILQPPTTTPTCTSRYGIILTTQRENTTIKIIKGVKWWYLEPCHEKHHVQHL
jgi:hypothetical protein